MLSIKRRSGAHIFREEAAFRRSEQGWPNWGELGPILLRSAGIAGLAGVIMVIATGDVLFTGPVRTASVQPETADAPDAAPAERATQVVAARDLSAEPVIEAPVVETPVAEARIVEEPAVEEPIAATKAADERVVEEPVIEQAAQEAPVQEEPQAIASAPEAPILDPHGPAMDAPGAFEPLAFVRTPTTQDPQTAAPGFASIGTFSRQPTPPKMTGSVEPQERQVAAPQVAAPSPIFDRPVALRGTQSEADRLGQSAGAGGNVSVVALATSERERTRSAPIDRSGEVSDPATWVEASAVCPRDWLDQGDGPDADFRASSDCEPTVALAAVEPSPDEGTEEEGAVLQEALESAAATHALKLSGFVARVPLVRPETPAWALKRKARSTYKKRRADWPDEPPPNCGTLHAYWRFVDRKTGTKEWYCR